MSRLPSQIFLLIIAAVCCTISSPLWAEALAVGTVEAEPGSHASGFLVVPAGLDAETRIPVSVFNGASDGPVLALIAGTHGYEYPGITALHRLRSALDPQVLRGKIIMVHIANLPAFLGRSTYVNPVDGKNLNRVYPGNAAGTQSERIAHAITTEVIERADYLIDLHAGDGNEALRPYVYMPVTGESDLDRGARGLAVAFGLDHIVIDAAPLRAIDDSLFTDQTALVRGIPAITTETGQLGSNDDHWVDMAEAGLWNVLRHLEMIPGDEQPNEGITWLSDYKVITSPQDGFFEALVRDGYTISEGARIGVLRDFFGNELQVIRAPFSGVINYVIGTPPVSTGEPVAMISRLVAE
jgi:hypothetical protein